MRHGYSFFAGAALLVACTHAYCECRLVRVAEWSVDAGRRQPLVDATINGQKVGVLLDTGANITLLTRSGAARLGLKREAAEGMSSYGMGGESRVETAQIAEFRMGSAVRKDWRVFVVGEHDLGADTTLLLGDDFLAKFDVELDFAHKAVRLFQAHDCASTPLAYWAPREASRVDIYPGPQIFVPVAVNGVTLNALLDTGATRSVLDLKVAGDIGIKPPPGTKSAGCVVGLGKASSNGWFAPVDSFTIGNETIRNTQLVVADLGRAIVPAGIETRPAKPVQGSPVMVLGMDFLGTHRVMLARSQGKVYFTPAVEPVFTTQPGRACDEPVPDAGTRIARSDEALRANPADAAALLQRALAHAEKNEPDAAFADVEAVLRIQPDNLEALYWRAAILNAKHEDARAVAAYDVYLARKPGDPRALEGRAITLMRVGRLDDALRDAGRVLDADASNKTARRLHAVVSYVSGRYPVAARDFDELQRLEPDPYTALWLYLARLRNGRDGSQQLLDYRRAAQPAMWPAPIIRFHLGEIGAQELMAEASRGAGEARDRECEARFHIAERRIAAGDISPGVALLREAVDGCPKSFDEYYAAAAELKRIDEGPGAAERRIGMAYYRGEGVKADPAKAVEHLARAVELGDAESAIRLGKIYEFGMGLPADDTQATLWYTRGAELGSGEAQFAASERYYKGLGVARDPVEAVKWWTLALDDPEANESVRKTIASAEAKVTPAEVARGRELAQAWRERRRPSPARKAS